MQRLAAAFERILKGDDAATALGLNLKVGRPQQADKHLEIAVAVADRIENAATQFRR
jgi:hypothetical protein